MKTKPTTRRNRTRHPRNETRYASLDRLAADPRVLRIWDEGDDGLWAHLAPGFLFYEACSLHEYTCRDLVSAAKMIEDWGDEDPRFADALSSDKGRFPATAEWDRPDFGDVHNELKRR